MIKVNLKRILKERKISLANLSKATGISTNALSSFQNQKTESVYYPTVEAITNELDISVGDLIENISEYYEVKVEIKDFVENKINIALVHFIGVEHDASYIHEIQFACEYQSNRILNNYKRLQIYISDEINKQVPQSVLKIMHDYDFSESGKGIYYCIGYLLLQELMKLPNYSSLKVTDKIILNTDAISYFQYTVDDTPKEISRNTGESMEYKFREIVNSLYLVTADRSINFFAHDPPKDVKYIPYIENLDELEFVTKVEIDPESLERKLFIN